MLDVTSELRGPTLVIRLTGRIDAGSSTMLQERAREWIQSGLKQLVFDLSAVSYVSSAGLRAFLLIAKNIQAVDGSIKLCSLTPPVQEVFDISGFSELFAVLSSVDAAL